MTLTHIDNPLSITLSHQEVELLQRLFVGYTQLVIERELGGGFSAGRIFVVRPLKANQADLPAVIKIGPIELIEKERRAYQAHIQNRLPNAQNIQNYTYSDDEGWAGLRYPLAGGGVFEIESLYSYLSRPDVTLQQINFTLHERLLKSLGHLWRTNQARLSYPTRDSYDPILPVNLIIEPIEFEATDREPRLLTPQNVVQSARLQVGDVVRLTGFIVTGIETADHQIEITLNRPTSNDNPPSSHRLRLLLASNAPQTPYQVGQKIAITGQVIATRSTQLEQLAAAALGQKIDLSKARLPLPEQAMSLPNPLLAYPTLLNHALDVRVAQTIHGDLNLENILVDPHTGDVSLIDFADARQDYVLHDLLRLETGVVTRLLPLTLTEANLPAETIHQLYLTLHKGIAFEEAALSAALKKSFTILSIIRQAVRPYLFDYHDLTEYYQGLTVYLLGALKFTNLNPIPMAKPTAFWGAATLVDLLQSPPVVKPIEPQPSSQKSISKQMVSFVAAAAIVFLTLILGGVWAISSSINSPSAPPAEPAIDNVLIATVIGFQPQVQHQAYGSDRLTAVDFGTDLYGGDRLYTHQGASVDIACLNGLLLRLPEQRNLTIECLAEAAGIQLIGQLGPQITALVTDTTPLVVNLSTTTERNVRTDEAAIPRLLSPRNSVIVDPQPTFEWQTVEGATGYRLTMLSAASGLWSQETTETSLPYPADRPPLTPDSSTIISIVPLNNPVEAATDKSLLRLINQADLATVKHVEADIQALGVDDSTRRFLLAQLYSQHDMWAAAIKHLSPLTETHASPKLWLQLGKLHAQIELYGLAEADYATALMLAEQNDNLLAQAEAHVGLAKIALVFNELTVAIEHLTMAEAGYRELGQIALAEQWVDELERLQAEP